MENIDNSYPSGELQLEIAKSEYNNEKNRSAVLDSKTNTVISFAAIFFVAIAQIVNLKKIFSFVIKSFSDAILPSILFIALLGSIILAFSSLIFFLRVIFTKSYSVVDPNYFYDVEKWKQSPDKFAIAASYFYINATLNNRAINDQRVNQYQKGIILLIISVALFSVYALINSSL